MLRTNLHCGHGTGDMLILAHRVVLSTPCWHSLSHGSGHGLVWSLGAISLQFLSILARQAMAARLRGCKLVTSSIVFFWYKRIECEYVSHSKNAKGMPSHTAHRQRMPRGYQGDAKPYGLAMSRQCQAILLMSLNGRHGCMLITTGPLGLAPRSQ